MVNEPSVFELLRFDCTSTREDFELKATASVLKRSPSQTRNLLLCIFSGGEGWWGDRGSELSPLRVTGFQREETRRQIHLLEG